MINIQKMFKGKAVKNGKIHYCYITKTRDYVYKETLCKVNKMKIEAVNYFSKVNCKSCLKRIQELHDFVRVALWYSNGFFYKGLVGINIKPSWADSFDIIHSDIDINMYPEDLIDKNNIKDFISSSENYIPLGQFINQNKKIIYMKEGDIDKTDNTKVKKIWILKTEVDIEADEKRLLEKKKQEVKEQVEEKNDYEPELVYGRTVSISRPLKRRGLFARIIRR